MIEIPSDDEYDEQMKLIRSVQNEFQILRTEQAQWMTQVSSQMRIME